TYQGSTARAGLSSPSLLEPETIASYVGRWIAWGLILMRRRTMREPSDPVTPLGASGIRLGQRTRRTPARRCRSRDRELRPDEPDMRRYPMVRYACGDHG